MSHYRALEQLADKEAATTLRHIEEALHAQVREGFEAFYWSFNSEITEQLDFTGRFFSAYPVLLGACDEIVKAGNMPIRRFTSEKGPERFSLITGLPHEARPPGGANGEGR